MKRNRLAQENDIEIVRQAAVLLERENQKLTAKILELTQQLAALKGEGDAQLKLRLADLERQIAQRNRMLFGSSSERRSDGDKTSSDDPNSDKDDKTPQKGHGRREQPSLPIEETVHDLDDADKMCPECGGELQEWEGQFEEAEEIDILERRFFIRRHKRKKYRCACGGCIETAPGSLKLFPGARYSIAFVLAVAVGKYLEHMPLERQVRSMAHAGLVVDSQTLFDQLHALARLVKPAYERLGEWQRAQSVIFVDETRWPVFGKSGQAAAASKWHMWVIASDGGVYYEIHDNRGAPAGKSILGDYQGYVLCDGYKVYDSLAAEQPRLQLVQCWSHVRRNFIEIENSFPVETTQILGLIRELYAIEARCPRGSDGDEERRKLRATESREVLARIQQWCVDVPCLPESGLGRAINYMTKRWSRLARFLDDPRLLLDNNAAERALRGPVVGRKNHYGSRSRRGTEVAAILYSLLESAKLVGLNPIEYMRRAVDAALRGESIPLPHELANASTAAR
jgi:transposase